MPDGRRRAKRSWERMLRRCLDCGDHKFHLYGGRGIGVCKDWALSFEVFYSHMGDRPLGRTLGRVNNDGDYEPGNCRWETAYEQNGNRRNTVWVEVGGVKERLSDLAQRIGISRSALYGRLKAGWDIQRAMTTPVRSSR